MRPLRYAPAPPSPPGPPQPRQREPPSQGVAIVGLVLNILVWPGLGSLVGGRKEGWAQGFLFLLGIPLALAFVGLVVMLITWLWALFTGVDMIEEAATAERERTARLLAGALPRPNPPDGLPGAETN